MSDILENLEGGYEVGRLILIIMILFVFEKYSGGVGWSCVQFFCEINIRGKAGDTGTYHVWRGVRVGV